MDILEQDVLEAIVHVAVLGAYADGHLAEEERDVLKECIATHAASEDECRSMLDFVKRLPEEHPRAKTQQRESRMKKVLKVLTKRKDRERAFHLAVQVTAAHEGIRTRESQLLVQLMFDLQIDGELAQKWIRGAKLDHSSGHALAAATLRSADSNTKAGSSAEASSNADKPADVPKDAKTMISKGQAKKRALTPTTPFNP